MSQQTDWEQHYRDGHTPWEKGCAAPPLLQWLGRHNAQIGESDRILVPGCGLGHDVRALAGKKPTSTIVGLDISASAIATASKFPRSGLESFQQQDFFNLPSEMRVAFDWVWEHTCFCAIDPSHRDDYVDAVHGALSDGGNLLAVFYLNPYDEEHQPGGRPPHGTSIEELEKRFVSSGLFAISEAYRPDVSYLGREGLEYFMRLTKA